MSENQVKFNALLDKVNKYFEENDFDYDVSYNLEKDNIDVYFLEKKTKKKTKFISGKFNDSIFDEIVAVFVTEGVRNIITRIGVGEINSKKEKELLN